MGHFDLHQGRYLTGEDVADGENLFTVRGFGTAEFEQGERTVVNGTTAHRPTATLVVNSKMARFFRRWLKDKKAKETDLEGKILLLGSAPTTFKGETIESVYIREVRNPETQTALPAT